MLSILVLQLVWGFCDATVVGVLSGHTPYGWKNSSCKASDTRSQVMCNLQVYDAAAAAAAANGVELLVQPEGYGLSGNPKKSGFFELQVEVGTTPCVDADATAAPQQTAISCTAKKNKIAIVTNIFTELKNHSRRITEVVFNDQGTIVAVHDKIHLFPITETAIFDVGHVKSTTFDLLGRRWGILICFEGVWPYTLGLGDFSEMQGMVDQGATAFVWSIGGMVPPEHFGQNLATKFDVFVLASEDDSIASRVSAIVDPTGKELIDKTVKLNLAGIGYTGHAKINIASLPSSTVV